MNATRTNNQNPKADNTPAAIPQTTPTSIGYGHPEYHFVQSISEMQKSLGEINSSIKALEKSVESTKSKVEDLVKWKNMILGGAIVAGVLISVFVFLLSKVSDYVTLKAPAGQNIQTPNTTQLVQPKLPTSKVD